MSKEDEDVSIATLLELLDDGESIIEIKHEEEEVSAEVENPADNLNLQLDFQCTEAQEQAVQTLNARRMPVRKCNATNNYCYDDDPNDEDFTIKPSRRSSTVKKPKAVRKPHKKKLPPAAKQEKSSISKNVAISTCKEILSIQAVGIKIGTRLKNVLLLSKSLRWVYCEWFYSDIDKCIFSNYNDLEASLKTNFPSLRTRMMTRTEWNILRRMLGKPRRCSEAFFKTEREILANKRKSISQVQQPKVAEIACFKDLPLKIPMKLFTGTQVTARLHKPLNGIFRGCIESVDHYNSTYRISFGRNLGIHSVPDYEVSSINSPEMFINKYYKQVNKSKMSMKKAITIPQDLLVKMVYSKNMLAAKKKQVMLLSTMNRGVEISNSFNTPISDDIEEKYEQARIDLQNINRQFKINLDEISLLTQEITPETDKAPANLKEMCKQEIVGRVEQINNKNQAIDADNTKLLDFVSEISYLVLISKSLADQDQNTYTLQYLHDSLENLKEKFRNDEELLLNFSQNIEIHFKHILMLLSKYRSAIQ